MSTEESFIPEECARWIYEKFECSMTKGGSLRINGILHRSEEKAWSFLLPMLSQQMKHLKYFDYFAGGDDAQKTYQYETLAEVRRMCSGQKLEREAERFTEMADGSFNIRDIQLMTVLGKSEDNLVCIDTSQDLLIHPSELDIGNFQKLSPNAFSEAMQNVGMCALSYDPTKDDRWEGDWRIGNKYIRNLTHYNLHINPPWRTIDSDFEPELPKEIRRILSHMVNDNEEQLEYLFDCIHYVLADRLYVYLVLSGSPGIGKGFFGTMMSELLGDSNVKDAPKGALKSSFNDLFSETRLVIHDEYPASTREEIASLKKNIEDKQSIQRKFKDSKNLEKIWASQLITVNKGIRYAFEPNERKFSVLDLNNIPLLEIMPETEINEVTRRITSDIEYLAKIGHFFLNRKPKSSARLPYRGKRFWQMVVAGLTGFNRYLYSTLREKYDKEIALNHIFKMYADSRKGNRYEEPTDEEALAHLEMWKLAGRPIADVFSRQGRVFLRSTIEPSVLQDVETATAEAYEVDFEDEFEHL